MVELDYGKPIRVFYSNLLSMGLDLHVDHGRLTVDGNVDILSPVLKEEIIKRKQFLIDLLTPAPVAELAPYFGRLLRLDELKEALRLAETIQAKVDATPCNGGWLLVTSKYPALDAVDDKQKASAPRAEHSGDVWTAARTHDNGN
jgi:hypothetical protein